MSTRRTGECALQALGTPKEGQEEERAASWDELGDSIAVRNQDSRLRLVIQPKATSSPHLVISFVTRQRSRSWVYIPPTS